jgi:hypothetical protein
MLVIIFSIMNEQMESIFSVAPDPFPQLQAKLRAGERNGDGYVFDHYTIPGTHLEVDRLRYSANESVNVVLRQGTPTPDPDFVTMPFEVRDVKPASLNRDVVVDLVAVHPDQPLRIERTDGTRNSTMKASWRFTPTGTISWDIPDVYSSRGPINQETFRLHLGWILGSAALLGMAPPRILTHKAS